MDLQQVHPFLFFKKRKIMATQSKKLIITLAFLLLAAISPNIFPAAQAGISSFSTMALQLLLPSALLIVIMILVSKKLKYYDIKRMALNGLVAGFLSTIALEIVREIGFRMGAMPGDLPRLMGVLMLNHFASGPDIWSDLAGWSYHFWNGAAFGVIFSLLLGQSKSWQGILYGLIIAAGFMVSPVVKSLGIGFFGIDFKDGYQFLLTVTLAHVAFGLTLGLLLSRWNSGIPAIVCRHMKCSPKHKHKPSFILEQI